MLTPGTLHDEYHNEVGKLMESELIGLGLIDKNDLANQDPKNPLYRKYFVPGKGVDWLRVAAVWFLCVIISAPSAQAGID